MKVQITKITAADPKTVIIPTLMIQVKIEYYFGVQIPLTVSGQLSIGNKCIALLHEITDNLNNQELRIEHIPNNPDRRFSTDKITHYYTTLLAELSPTAIDWIEQCRESSSSKSVCLNCSFLVKQLYNSGQLFKENYNYEIVSMKPEKCSDKQEIEQSQWLREFAPNLGIGNFLLLELQRPDNKNIDEFWKEFYERLGQNLREMEDCLRSGDWLQTMVHARKFYESSKIGDKKPAHALFRQELGKLMKQDQQSDEAMENFYNGIKEFFEFTSKYVHDKDRPGHFLPKVIARKEDAYFVYSLAFGLFNLIGRKLESK